MTPVAETLPDDPETLKAMLIAERIRSERLVQIIKDMQRHRFGRRAETLPADQLLLALEEVEQNEAEAAAEAEAKSPPMREESKRKRRNNRGALPSHLPEIETTVDVEDKACPCCGGELHRIGEDVSKKLDVVPVRFRVLVVRRPKYACRACEDVVVQAPAPARLIEGGLPTEALVAHVLVSKYADHLPLYRQAQIYERQGLHLDRSTLADWVGRAAFHLRPIRERILAHLRSSTKLFADETTAPVLDPGRGRTKTGQLWAYARDDRPWGGADPPAVAYVYAPDRTASQPIAHLAQFKGVLQVDGYAGYRALAQKGEVSLAFCWSHVRRRFYDRAIAEASPIAHEALRRIARLYGIEKDIRGRSADERRDARQELSRPIVDELEPWLRAKLALISKKSKLAEAIRYALARWEGLCRFVDDGRIEIDSNTVERSIRPLALNRKNALFAGSDGGGDNWAVIATLIENCKLNGVEPHAYDGAYDWMEAYYRAIGSPPEQSVDRVYDIISDSKIPFRVFRRTWRNEIEKRVFGFNACTGRYICRIDADEILFFDDKMLERYFNEEHAVAQIEMPELIAPGWMLSSNPIGRQSFLFDRSQIDAEAHINYLWLVLTADKRPGAELTTKSVFDQPVAFNAHLTHWRTWHTSVYRAAFYLLNYMRGNGVPFIPELRGKPLSDLRSLFDIISPGAFREFLLTNSIVTGNANFVDGLALRKVPLSSVDQLKYAQYFAEYKSSFVELNKYFARSYTNFISGQMLTFDLSTPEAQGSLVIDDKVQIQTDSNISAALATINYLQTEEPWNVYDTIEVSVEGNRATLQVKGKVPIRPPQLRVVLRVQLWLCDGKLLDRFTFISS